MWKPLQILIVSMFAPSDVAEDAATRTGQAKLHRARMRHWFKIKNRKHLAVKADHGVLRI
jgi:hypothetical protein